MLIKNGSLLYRALINLSSQHDNIYLIYTTIVYNNFTILVEIHRNVNIIFYIICIRILHKNVKKTILFQLSQVLHNAVQTVVHVLTQHNSTQ